MIEYKVRAKHLGEWVEGYFCVYRGLPQILLDELSWESIDDIKTLGRYTGLCDKNGTRIFEGDILVDVRRKGGFDERIYRYEAIYTSDDVGSCGCCNAEFSGIGFVFQSIIGTRFRGKFDELEIIGNIHDNPKLLEVK